MINGLAMLCYILWQNWLYRRPNAFIQETCQ